MKTLEITLAEIIGFDNVNLLFNKEDKRITAVISSEKTISNFYKLFVVFVNEFQNTENDYEAKRILSNSLKQILQNFDDILKERKANLEKIFCEVNPIIQLNLSGEVKNIYNKVKEIVDLYSDN